MKKGFTLIEIMVAVLLSSLAILALVGIFSSAFHWYAVTFQQGVVQGGTILSLGYLSHDLERTTYISSPASPCAPPNVCPPCSGAACTSPSIGSDTLTGCTNYDPALGIIDPSQPMHVYSYCVNNGNMYYTWLDGSSLACPPVVSCGSAISGGNNFLRLASGVQRDTSGNDNDCSGNPYFCRPAFNNSTVELHYWISEPEASATIKVDTSVGAMMTSSPP